MEIRKKGGGIGRGDKISFVDICRSGELEVFKLIVLVRVIAHLPPFLSHHPVVGLEDLSLRIPMRLRNPFSPSTFSFVVEGVAVAFADIKL